MPTRTIGNLAPRDDAAAWFRFLASAGYELSDIEQAVADGEAYTGGHASDNLVVVSAPDGGNDPLTEEQAEAGGSVTGGEPTG